MSAALEDYQVSNVLRVASLYLHHQTFSDNPSRSSSPTHHKHPRHQATLTHHHHHRHQATKPVPPAHHHHDHPRQPIMVPSPTHHEHSRHQANPSTHQPIIANHHHHGQPRHQAYVFHQPIIITLANPSWPPSPLAIKPIPRPARPCLYLGGHPYRSGW